MLSHHHTVVESDELRVFLLFKLVINRFLFPRHRSLTSSFFFAPHYDGVLRTTRRTVGDGFECDIGPPFIFKKGTSGCIEIGPRCGNCARVRWTSWRFRTTTTTLTHALLRGDLF